MGHEIHSEDKVVSVQPTWHKLEELVEEIGFDNSGLKWDVEKRQLFLPVNGQLCPIDGWEAVVRKDKDLLLHIAKNTYTPIQNSRVWEAIENSLVGIGYKIETTGSLFNCRKVFISISIDEKQDYLVNKDAWKNFLTFVTSHDGSLGFEAYDTGIRVVCWNTLNWSRLQKGILNMKVYHTKNNEIKIKDMEETLEKLFEKREEFYTSLEYLASKPMTLEQANKVLVGFIGSGEELSKRAENQINDIVAMFAHGKGNVGKTRYDLLNGVTQYFTHEVSDNKRKLFASNEFGAAGEKKLEMYDILMSDEEITKLVKKGEILLKKAQVEIV